MTPTPLTQHKDLFEDKNHLCEHCQIKGKKRYAFRTANVKGLTLWLCWDCCLDEVFKQKKEAKPTREIPDWEEKY